MTGKKTIVVLGATGNQGGSVVNTFLLQDSQWKVRGVTRNTNSKKAEDLANRGVEVLAADLNDRNSLDAVFANAHAIFIVSDFWGIYGDPANSSKPA